MSPAWGAYWMPRALHPLAWWMWALGLTVAASRTTNPLLLGAILGVATWVVLGRRSDAPWASAFRIYVIAGALVVGIRVVFRIVFGGAQPGHVLVRLPEIPLPDVAAGVNLFGAVTAESLLSGFYDGLRLATMLICLGAANALANPRRLLRAMPPALHEVSTAVVVAISVFPQLAESVVRVRRARKLRPGGIERRLSALRSVVVSVLEDAMDRSLLLAASMDSRGYGRSGNRSRATTVLSGACMVAGLAGMAIGAYALLDGTAPRQLATPVLIGAIALGVVGIALSGKGVERTCYRPDQWRLAELVTAGSGLAAGMLLTLTTRIDPSNLNPSIQPLTWPQLSWLPVAGILAALMPAFLTPAAANVEAATPV
ncbi:MAG: energy-coupling factor transporter transmembrane protein EcfT [Nocardioidaceae bacterium]|nr:energy-coupling factor transporter transmembrane protein EcfT [Nocardioidaceae bacterium]